MSPVALRFAGVSRSFPGVRALEDVSFEVRAGSVHALCGENGAGKSTLGRMIAGIHPPDAGVIEVFGAEASLRSPREALALGIGMVHQELAFCENLTVAENLCLAALPARRGFLDRGALESRARAMLAGIDPDIDVTASLGALSLGHRQMVQVAQAVGAGARIILFDEPTSSLSQREAERLYALIARLKNEGVTSIYVSHRMDEIFRLCDTVTVLRDGRHVATRPLSEVDEAALVRMMIGREVEDASPAATPDPGAERLRVRELGSAGKFEGISFTLRAGEVLGLAGLVGAGRSEIAQALFGLDPAATGGIAIDGVERRIDSPESALRAGLGLVPEDRKKQGLVLEQGGRFNATLPILSRLARFTFTRPGHEGEITRGYFERLRVRAPGIESALAGLSGGNQQKVVLAKWLAANARILILDEPTRGVDVGAKAEIHALIEALAREGRAILLISSELPELLRLSTRVLVVREGRLAGELDRAATTPDAVLRLMAGLAA